MSLRLIITLTLLLLATPRPVCACSCGTDPEHQILVGDVIAQNGGFIVWQDVGAWVEVTPAEPPEVVVERDGEYGKCGLFQQGKVPVTAWCTSWIKKAGV